MPTHTPFVKNLLQLNLAMLLISTSGVLGRSIALLPTVTIGFRALLAAVFLFAFLKWRKINLSIAKKDIPIILGSGFLMGAHWVLYFQSLQLSNVAIGMLTIFTYPAITSILAPLLLKTGFQKVHLLLGILVLVGIGFLVPDFDFENRYTQAVGLGLLSALAYALRNILIKKKVAVYHGSLLMWYQMLVVGGLLLPLLFMVEGQPLMDAIPMLLFLALVTTAIGHTLFLMTFKHFSITTASIISATQPVYGILIGILILGEVPAVHTIIGGVLILSAVFVESFREMKTSKGHTSE